MIARIKFGYAERSLLVAAANDEDKMAVLRQIFGPAIPDKEHIGMDYMWPENILIDMDSDGPALTALGVTFEVVNFKGTMALKTILPDGQHVNVYVQVPNIGLLTMDEVEVREDYCTDALQRDLNEGWRILAICPPNAARRPDYILGRTKDRR